MDDYQAFLARKAPVDVATGIDYDCEIHDGLYEFQRAVVRWNLRRGRAANLLDTGLGKSRVMMETARHVIAHTAHPTLVLAPLAVTHQLAREAAAIGVDAKVVSSQADVPEDPQVVITNYDKLHRFDPGFFSCVMIDEASILKSFDGKLRTLIIETFRQTPFRYAFTATPAPNDHMELGNLAEFIGAMTRTEMLSTFFVHDGGDTSKWRLKGHAEKEFWKWICSWAVAAKHPRDIGFDQEGYDLPPLTIHEHVVDVAVAHARPPELNKTGYLFAMEAVTLAEQRSERKATIDDRVAMAAELVARECDEPWVVWCDLNAESDALAKAIPGAVEITGSDTPSQKESAMLGFSNGTIKTIVTKSKIAGFGMNWQHCARQVFVGVSHSFEAFYQSLRRSWRFGQDRPVDAHVIIASTEGRVVENLKRKERDAQKLMREMVAAMADISKGELVTAVKQLRDDYDPQIDMEVPQWVRSYAEEKLPW